MRKTISILGSTGSIGKSTLSIVDKKKNYFNINILSANKNFKQICMQIKKYKPKYFIVTNDKIYQKVKKKFKKKNTKILNKINFFFLKKKNDITISAIPGIAGLEPTINIIKFTKKLLIANKESIICGWSLIKLNALKNKTELIPIDSEHFSIFKLLENQNKDEIEKIYITASGGPFLNYKIKKLKDITPKEALKHPKWNMGKKISIDSSTLMNKIFEFIEAQKLFDLTSDKLDILIHPESLVHAIIVLKNGLTKLIYHNTSMIIPLANAIFGSEFNIKDFYNVKILNKKKHIDIKNLTFQKVNEKIFPSITIKKEVNKYPSSSIIINACNEILVDQFLKKNIPFLSIFKTIKTIMNDRNYKKYAIRRPKNLNQINTIDFWARRITLNKIRKYA